MTFKDKLYISEVQIKEPEDEEDWTTKIAKILLCDRKKYEGVDSDGCNAKRKNKNVESYKSRNRCK